MAELDSDESPLLVYYENGIPNLFTGNLMDEKSVFSWLVAQRNANGIEDVSDGLLRKVIEDNEFVAVLFRYSGCKSFLFFYHISYNLSENIRNPEKAISCHFFNFSI